MHFCSTRKHHTPNNTSRSRVDSKDVLLFLRPSSMMFGGCKTFPVLLRNYFNSTLEIACISQATRWLHTLQLWESSSCSSLKDSNSFTTMGIVSCPVLMNARGRQRWNVHSTLPCPPPTSDCPTMNTVVAWIAAYRATDRVWIRVRLTIRFKSYSTDVMCDPTRWWWRHRKFTTHNEEQVWPPFPGDYCFPQRPLKIFTFITEWLDWLVGYSDNLRVRILIHLCAVLVSKISPHTVRRKITLILRRVSSTDCPLIRRDETNKTATKMIRWRLPNSTSFINSLKHFCLFLILILSLPTQLPWLRSQQNCHGALLCN